MTAPINKADLKKLATHAVHYGNCDMETWDFAKPSCSCGLFELLDKIGFDMDDDGLIAGKQPLTERKVVKRKKAVKAPTMTLKLIDEAGVVHMEIKTDVHAGDRAIAMLGLVNVAQADLMGGPAKDDAE